MKMEFNDTYGILRLAGKEVPHKKTFEVTPNISLAPQLNKKSAPIISPKEVKYQTFEHPLPGDVDPYDVLFENFWNELPIRLSV